MGVATDPHSMLGFSQFKPHQTTMETFLTPDEILELVTTGVCKLSDDLMLRMTPKVSESYEDSDWYNDPNCTMSRHHY
jgi:hypothetical protein